MGLLNHFVGKKQKQEEVDKALRCWKCRKQTCSAPAAEIAQFSTDGRHVCHGCKIAYCLDCALTLRVQELPVGYTRVIGRPVRPDLGDRESSDRVSVCDKCLMPKVMNEFDRVIPSLMARNLLSGSPDALQPTNWRRSILT
jgi:hypothetical protein